MKPQYIIDGVTGTETIVNGKKYLYFAGTGYFQLNAHPELIKAASDATLKYGIATATSRAITGNSHLLIEIEKKAVDFFNTEDAVYLPSGYLTNIAGLQALNELNTFDIIFLDEGAHYSLCEGARTVDKPLILFNHCDTEDLKQKLEQHLQPGQRPLIASDGLFPIRAKIAPIETYLELADIYNGTVWIDDAHGVGILGENGRGTCEHLALKSPRLFMGATLSKAFGAYGGIIPGTARFIQQIKSGSVMTGSSSPMHAAVAAGIKGLEIVQQHPEMREKLWANARYLKEQMRSIGIQTEDNELPIVAFSPGNMETMTKIHQELMEKGVYIQFANYKGSGNDGILRIVVFSTHTQTQINILTEKLDSAMRKFIS
ncbi:aminotransferase class I/II-fold pyridoxal phosphate-dependent enzyme [Maribellus sediminis]|uniref:aminotransferase class I/II-fold pyridoxal phosphate-dependent enzyme n=1 Tax=Maribellus sediminis TaxID=2696285 RepID=UPI001430BBC4|nr:pyridoxal phosphate-dependent aminotransferase family protein [Maribellus sediminis]